MVRPVAIVPARGGSKGVPGKNVKPLAGKPLVAWTFEAALASSSVDLFVSTDDEAVKTIAQSYGISCGYTRPAALATDEATMADTVADALAWLRAKGVAPEVFVLLQPTSPFRTAADIVGSLRTLEESPDADAVFGVSPMWTHPYDCIRWNGGSAWEPLARPSKEVSRRQDFQESFHFINGALYTCRVEAFLATRKFISERSVPFSMAPENTCDIDTPLDFTIAEALFLARAQGIRGPEGTLFP